MKTTTPQLIITHPGSAHFDEVTAIALVLASFPDASFRIERREPSVSELEDPDAWVIDVGDCHEPDKRNFDHHQSLDCPASFMLVADYLGLSKTMSVLPWWRFKDEVDRIGPARASEHFNAGDDLVNRNPVEDWLTDAFAQNPGDCIPLLRAYGSFIIGQARMVKTQVDFWNQAERLAIGSVTAMIGETRESAGLEEYRRLYKNPPDIVISMDRRSDGWRLFRYDGAPVDFSRLAGDPAIEFAHKSGFMAKTREKISKDALVALIAKAVISPEECS